MIKQLPIYRNQFCPPIDADNKNYQCSDEKAIDSIVSYLEKNGINFKTKLASKPKTPTSKIA